jgi:hypothetical protein
MSKFKIGDRVENILAAEDGEEDRFRYGVVYDIYPNRHDGEEVIEVEYPGYHYAEISGEWLRPDTRGAEK